MIDLPSAWWDSIDRRIQTQAAAIVRESIANLRPGGAHPLAVEVAAPTASTTKPVAKIPVLYPAVITSVDLAAQPGEVTGTVTVDIKVARPGEALADATSICAPNYPTLTVDVDWVHVLPTLEGEGAWLTTYLEPGSMMLLYIRSTHASRTSLLISVNVRCL